MAEKKTTVTAAAKKKTVKKTQTKKTGIKKLTIEVDAAFLEELESYVEEFGFQRDEFVKKAILEKISRDKISMMIELVAVK